MLTDDVAPILPDLLCLARYSAGNHGQLVRKSKKSMQLIHSPPTLLVIDPLLPDHPAINRAISNGPDGE